MSSNIKMENGLGFKFNHDNTKLLAVFTPCENKLELTTAIVKKRLEQEQLSYLFIEEDSLIELVHRYNHTDNTPFELKIAERHDAKCEIYLSTDKMKAYLKLTANLGGAVVTLKDVERVLQEKAITYGIVDNDIIESILKKGKVADFIIAEGLEPVAGVDTQFKSFIEPEIHERKPYVNNEGVVDYRELGDIVITVHEGDVLMQRIPPTNGIEGRNVLGEMIEPKKGENIPFSHDKKGVYLDPDNRDLLLSAIVGQPIIIPFGMIVSPILTIEQVDFLSGNVRFDGSVVVNGDVIDGMKVYAIEDILIEGSVNNAKLECMGNITVKGCVTGNSELLANGDVIIKGGIQGYSEIGDATDNDYQAKIIAHGSVIVGFAENFSIEAGVDIVVEKYAMNNHLMAQNKIVAGAKNSGKKSSIIGGVTWAMMLVKAATVGSTSGLKTRIKVGFDPYIYKRMATIKKMLLPNEKEQDGIQKILEFMEHHPEKGNIEILEKLNHTLSKLKTMADLYHIELKELTANSTVIQNAKVIVDRGVYTGTEIKINNVLWKAQENRGKSVFRIEQREITINTR